MPFAGIKRSEFEAHPACVTIGTLVDIDYDEEGRFGPQIVWKFDTQETMEDGRAFRVTYWTTPKLNEKSNLFALLKAFGEDPNDPKWEVEQLSDLDELLNRKVQLDIIHKKTETGVTARVDKVMALPRRQAREAAPAGRQSQETGRQQPPQRQPAPVAAAAGTDLWSDEA